MNEIVQHPDEADLHTAMSGLLSQRPVASDADPQAADLEGEAGDGADKDIEDDDDSDATKAWSDDEIAAAEEPFTEADVKAALARSTSAMREMLSAQDADA